MQKHIHRHEHRLDGRIPELDGLRVLLVFIVSWYHIWQQSWLTPHIGSVSLDFLLRTGYMMVDGTILLSGFLLYLPYAQAQRSGGPLPERRAFYQRRVTRILPSYLFLLAVAFFLMALPWGLYYSPQYMVKDLVTHLTFTFTFFRDTYIHTPLGAAPWTLAIELQAYLLFPLIARCAMKKPRITIPAMVAIAFAWRGWSIWALSDYNMVVNQLPSFLDIYAVGILAAIAYTRLREIKWQGWKRLLLEIVATAVLVACVAGAVQLLRDQASSGGQNGIQWGQMVRRFPFTLLVCGVMLSLPFALRPIRALMGNRVMRFLSGISMNYYLIHQTLIVHLRRMNIPFSEHVYPNQMGETAWQLQYTALSFGLSLLAAILVTYLVERPAARALKKYFARCNARKLHQVHPRAKQLARQVVQTSCRVQPGEKVWLEGRGAPADFMANLVEEVYAAGGVPFVHLRDPKVEHALAQHTTKVHQEWLAEGDTQRMAECQVYIGVHGGNIWSPPHAQAALIATYYNAPVHVMSRVYGTRWAALRYPDKAIASRAGMREDVFADAYYAACNVDFIRMQSAMDALVARMNEAEEVRITGPETDLRFSVKGMRAIACTGEHGLPDGEVYTVPRAGTVEGTVTFNMPNVCEGTGYQPICLRFEKGRVVEAYPDAINAHLDTDVGARAVGEFALGLNPCLTRPTGSPLLDGKMTGTFHISLGRAWGDCDNGNRSAIHWDLVCSQNPEHGGGEILLDGQLLRKDGRFVPEELQPLNP